MFGYSTGASAAMGTTLAEEPTRLCKQCKVGRQHVCNLEYDRVLLVDNFGRIFLDYPSATRADSVAMLGELAAACDRTSVEQALREAIEHDRPARCLFREAGSGQLWLAHICRPKVYGLRNGVILALLILRPVCDLVLALSRRQREILRCLTCNPNVESVARRLGIAPSTVRAHLFRAQTATQISGLDELLLWGASMWHVLEAESELKAFKLRRKNAG